MCKFLTRYTAIALVVALLSGIVSEAPLYAQDEEYDPLHTMLALNMAIVSVHKIATTQDRIVLDQEYNTIINKLALGNIESDYELTGLYTELMDFITGKLLRQEEAKRFKERYNRQEQRQIVNALSGIRAYGGNLWSWLGSLATSCTSAYFSYQNSKNELIEGLDDELWKLKKEDIEDCNDLQTKLLKSSWELLRKYKDRLPDDYRLTQETLDNFFGAIQEKDSAKKLRRLRSRQMERNFKVYPPYWYYRAKAAQEANDEAEASKCFDKFDEIWRPVLKFDPYKLESAKYRVQKLAKNGKPSGEAEAEIKKQLEIICDYAPDGDWANNLFAGVVYFALGEKDLGLELVETNVDANYEKDISGAVLAQMQAGKLEPETLPDELREMLQTLTIHENLLSKVQDKPLADALINYFDGNENSAEATLERLSKTSTNPVVFDALKLIDYMKFNTGKNSYHIVYVYKYRHYDDLVSPYAEIKHIIEFYADKKIPAAQVFLGFMYANGVGVEEDREKALELLLQPAQNGYAYAQYLMYCYSPNVDLYVRNELIDDINSTVHLKYRWLLKASFQNFPPAVSAILCIPEILAQDFHTYEGRILFFEFIHMLAQLGNVDAMNRLAELYSEGDGCGKDLKQAEYWEKKSLEKMEGR